MSRRYDSAIAWVRDSMPIESQQALETFTRVNKHWQGAHWDDCLEALMDSDSHCEMTEPLYDDEVLRSLGFLPEAIAITCLWASKRFAEATPEEKRLMVRLVIVSNGGFLEALWRHEAFGGSQ